MILCLHVRDGAIREDQEDSVSANVFLTLLGNISCCRDDRRKVRGTIQFCKRQRVPIGSQEAINAIHLGLYDYHGQLKILG